MLSNILMDLPINADQHFPSQYFFVNDRLRFWKKAALINHCFAGDKDNNTPNTSSMIFP